MFTSLLIANRGEIACRIVRTCRRMGIHSVAVYSDADRDALHVREAEEAIHIGGAAPGESYLDGAKIVAAALRAGVEAIHPGYGFLSEQAGFARAAAEAGLVFVGPPPGAMEIMGAKDRAKAAVAAVGLPLVPGWQGDAQDAASLQREADGLGYPLLLKAVAGGGGRGMRLVERGCDFAAMLESAQREALGAFGDDRMLLEAYVRHPRHIEVQVMADAHGNAVHLFERDCSLQRRHQKIVEEAPAPGLSDELRSALGAAAVKAALAVGYVNAGTVEFLVDPAGHFYFIEMNTRLQVEHPVTEVITGLDLVEWQLRIAAGEKLPLRQDEIVCRGHAFEARLYAEDPAKGFLPQTGPLGTLRFPAGMNGVRIDAGVAEGDAVTPHYDAMIAKIIAHGPDREAARTRLLAALAATEIDGLVTNLPFLARVVASDACRDATFHASWLDDEGAELSADPGPDADDLAIAALAVVLRRIVDATERAASAPDFTSPWHRADGWRLNRPWTQEVTFLGDELPVVMVVEKRQDAWRVSGAGHDLDIRAGLVDGELWIERDGHRRRLAVSFAADEVTLRGPSRIVRLRLGTGEGVREGEGVAAGLLVAPMPGKVTRLLVGIGQTVMAGETLAVVEAMKMEHRVTAPRAGVVTACRVREGEQVEDGAVLLDLGPLP